MADGLARGVKDALNANLQGCDGVDSPRTRSS